MTRGKPPGQKILDAASEFLRHPLDRHRKEGNLQSDLEALLRVVDVGTLESHYSTVDGEADIYLPNRRTFIELKAYPLAANPDKPQQGKLSESPRAQLDRYVIGEINRELGRIPFDDVEFVRSNWVGIVTDGRNWHVYEYGHRIQSVGESVDSREFTNEALPLAGFLHSLLGDRNFGREWIPSDPGDLFTGLKDELVELNSSLPAKAVATTSTKKQLWLDMMRTSGMVPTNEAGKERLFVVHSFLISVVRLVSHTLFPAISGPDWEPALRDGFTAWVLEFERGRRWAGRLHRLVSGYDWRRREEDVLRSLYHHNVSAHDRKVFGEFYTPDWLAEMMVEEVLDEAWMEHAINGAAVAMRSGESMAGIGVLDPTCGSGTFLLHAARRLLAAGPMQGFTPVDKADIVSRLVNGIDIHPVAVELARVNLERILPAPPSMGYQAFQIHLGDSLQADSKQGQQSLFSHSENMMRVETPGSRRLSIPMGFVRRATFANDMRFMVDAAASEQPLPDHLTVSLTEDEVTELEQCHSDLAGIIEAEGNSVWTWYIINIAAPHLLSLRKVNRIVANPPWVKLAEIQVKNRKETMEQYGLSLRLKGVGKQAPHPDIASYFILAARKLYLASPESDPACWLVKKSAIASGQWHPFRVVHRDTLRQSVDLEQLQPFGGGDATRSCLLMEHRHMTVFDSSGSPRLEARLKAPRDRPKSMEALAIARRKFDFVEAPAPLPQAQSVYFSSVRIRQGATLVPHVLSILDEVEAPDHDDLVRVTTRRSSKGVWKTISPQTGRIPSRWVVPVLTSSRMMAYIPSLGITRAIVPVDGKRRLYKTPGEVCSFWSELDEIYETNAGIGKGTPKTLLTQIDFQSKLSSQLDVDPDLQWMVLYPASGDIMRATRTRIGSSIVDSKLFWLPVTSEEEAGYLVAILNSACLQRAFRESRDSGRDFHLHPWRKVPIPRYVGSNRKHRRLAELCSDAEKIALEAAEKKLAEKPGMGQVGISKAIRAALNASEVGREVEAIVLDLLPAHSTAEHLGPDTSRESDLFCSDNT